MVFTTPQDVARKWINNVRVGLDKSPLLICVDFSMGPFYAMGDKVRLVDLDPAGGFVLGRVSDIKKLDNGVFAAVVWSQEDFIPWDPQEESSLA